MHHITFISTIHKEIGKCNPEELHKIIEVISPEVIFLEAIEETYSNYEHYLFSTYGQFHNKLEISAIQRYNENHAFHYEPVCGIGLSEAFNKKIEFVSQYKELQELIDNFNSLAKEIGFDFLNSSECIKLQEEMRSMESQIFNNPRMDEIIKADIEAYEEPMIQKILSYCKSNNFESAIFMCGAAHRRSIIEKIEKSKIDELVKLSWTIYGN